MFLGLLEPDPLVIGMDPDRDPYVFGLPGSRSVSQEVQIRIRILPSSSKNSKEKL
jgi:hypothetical protein